MECVECHVQKPNRRSLRYHYWIRHKKVYYANKPARDPKDQQEFEEYDATIRRARGQRPRTKREPMKKAEPEEKTKESRLEKHEPRPENQTKLESKDEETRPEKQTKREEQRREEKLVRLVERYSELTEDFVNWIKRAEKRKLKAEEESIRERKRRLIETLTIIECL